MKTTQSRKSSESTASQPSWRKPPAKKRPKMHTKQAVITSLPKPLRLPAWRPWAVRLPRIPWRLLALVPVAALVIFAAIEVATNDTFYVYSAEIRGNQRVATDEIYVTAGIDRKNILWVNPADVSRKVQAVPGIAGAQVHVWPPNRVTIDVQEETPLLVWRIKDQSRWIATDGRPMPANGTAPGLTLIDADGAAAGSSGQRSGRAAGSAPTAAVGDLANARLRPTLVEALKVLHERRPDLAEIYYGRQEGLYFVADPGGWTVYVGESGNIGARLDLLAAAQPTLAGEKAKPKVVDLRLDNKVIYR